MRVGRSGFTLVELMAVVTILAIIAVVALPKFYDMTDEAKKSSVQGVLGALQEGIALMHTAYIVGETDGLPPDINGDCWPDHLGDTALGEPTLFDAVLQVPVTVQSNGWKQETPFPALGVWHAYFYDYDGSGSFNIAYEVRVAYNTSTGELIIITPW